MYNFHNYLRLLLIIMVVNVQAKRQLKTFLPSKKRNNNLSSSDRNLSQKSLPSFLESRVYSSACSASVQKPSHSSMKLTEGFLCDDGLKVLAVSRQKSQKVQEEKFCDKPALIYYINFLCISFPEFPKSMMESLVARFDGNCDSVYNFLLERDWQPKSVDLVFEDKLDEHFTCPYYFGKAPSKSEISRLLKPCKTGNFITFYRPFGENQFRYYVCYKRGSEILEKAIRLPFIPDVLRNTLGLTKGMRCTYARDKSFIPLYK